MHHGHHDFEDAFILAQVRPSQAAAHPLQLPSPPLTWSLQWKFRLKNRMHAGDLEIFRVKINRNDIDM